jgi:hypothetical protein
MLPFCGSRATSATCRPGNAEPAKPLANRSFRGILHLSGRTSCDLPVGWVVAAVDVAELLAQILLRVSVPALDTDGGGWIRICSARALRSCVG